MNETIAAETRLDDPADPAAHAEAVVRRAGTSFYWAMRRMPERHRRAMFAVYAFCREVDDIADEPGEENAKRLALGNWRGEIERLYGGHPRGLTAQALLPAVEQFELAKEDFLAVIAGMEMDAGTRTRIADMDELTLYCDRVACAVGRLSTRVFGLDAETGRRLAFAEGMALQLTNILRDVVEDAQRGRLYLPADVLAAHDIIETDDLKQVLAHPRLHQVCEVLAGVAEHQFADALALAATCDPARVRPAMMMLQVYRRILERLQWRGWHDLGRPVSLSKLTKLWVAFRYGVL
ncbi:MAG: presqualene diphosphate synthase HpnD [Rhodospirillaceae bacterium]